MKNQKYVIMEESNCNSLYIHSTGFNTYEEAEQRAKELQTYFPDLYFYAIDERTANCIVTD